MGYFSNGTEGTDYEVEYCEKCIHGGDNDCPIWGLHLLYNYDQLKETPEGEALAVVLGTLIPRSKDDLDNLRCSMFIPLTELKELPAKAPTVEPEKVRTFWVAQ